MPNYKKHAQTGAIVGGITAIGLNISHQLNSISEDGSKKFDFTELAVSALTGSIVGLFGGVLPDKLEPGNNPFHRKFFHSFTAASLVGYGIYKTHTSSKLSKIEKGTISIAGIGYLSHLILDSRTPMSLPII